MSFDVTVLSTELNPKSTEGFTSRELTLRFQMRLAGELSGIASARDHSQNIGYFITTRVRYLYFVSF